MSKLYILRPADDDNPLWEPWFDKSFGFIVSAKSHIEARKLAAEDCGDEGEKAWLDAANSTCSELKPTTTSKIIMRDFHSA